jgi:hypothetical protein
MSAYTEPDFIYNNSQDCINQIQDRIASLFDTSTSTLLSISTGLKITNPSNNYYVDVAQGGLDTNNPLGITINPATGYTTACNFGGDIDMNSNDINNVNSLNSTAGNSLTISSSNQTNMNSTDDFNINADINFIVNSNANVLFNSNGTFINTLGGGGGDGDIYALNFYGNASSASFANSATNSTNSDNILITSDNTSGTYYIPFSKTSGTGNKGLFQDDTTTALTYNPNTSTLTATTFTGTLNGTANSATNSQNSTIIAGNILNSSNWFPCVVNSSTAGNYNLTSYSNLSYIPNTNTFSCNISGNSSTATNATNAINCSTTSTTTSGTYYPVFVSSNVSGNYPNLVGVMTYNPSTNTITANTFNGALSGTATNATNVGITSDNTSGTYYIPFAKTSGTGNKPLFQDDTTGPLTYNPSTGNMSAISYTITGTPSTASVASTFGQVGLVYLSTTQFSIVGSASAQSLSVASIFNSTYQNYRVVLNSATQVSFTAYPNYSLAGYLGTGVPTTGSLYGNELTSASSSAIVAVYTAGATLSSAPLTFAVSSLTNKQVVLEVENVGFANTASQVVGLKCKSFYGNPGVSGYSDRNILSTSLNGATITGLTIQQSSLGVGNNMTLQVVVYGYNNI